MGDVNLLVDAHERYERARPKKGDVLVVRPDAPESWITSYGGLALRVWEDRGESLVVVAMGGPCRGAMFTFDYMDLLQAYVCREHPA